MSAFDKEEPLTVFTNYLIRELGSDGLVSQRACTGYIHNHLPSEATARKLKSHIDNAGTVPQCAFFLAHIEAVIEILASLGPSPGTRIVSVDPAAFTDLRYMKDYAYWQEKSPESFPYRDRRSVGPGPPMSSAGSDTPIGYKEAKELLQGNKEVTFVPIARVLFHNEETRAQSARAGLLTEEKKYRPLNRFCTNSASSVRTVAEQLSILQRAQNDLEALGSCRKAISDLSSSGIGGPVYREESNTVMDQLLSDPECSIPLHQAIRERYEKDQTESRQ